MNLRNALGTVPILYDAISQPPDYVHQTPFGDVAGNELRQAISHDHGMPVRCFAVRVRRFGRNAEPNPRTIGSFACKTYVGLGPYSPDELHVGP